MKIRVFDVDRLEGVAREGADAAAADADADADGAEVDVVMETTQDGVVKVSIDDPKAPRPDDVGRPTPCEPTTILWPSGTSLPSLCMHLPLKDGRCTGALLVWR